MSDFSDLMLSYDPAFYWKLDSVQLGTDITGNGRTGSASGGVTIGGSASALPIVGEDGTATDFDGTDDKITVSYNPFTNGTARTFCGWAIRDTTASEDCLFGSVGGTANDVAYLHMPIGAPGSPQIRAGGNDEDADGFTNAWPSTGAWAFWVLTFNESTDTAKWYVNGASYGSASHTATYDAASGNFQLGAVLATTFPFDGKMAHAAVFEYELTESQVKSLYYYALNGRTVSVSIPYDVLLMSYNPEHYLRLGEPSGTTAEDASPNNRDGTYVNTPTLAQASSLENDADTSVDFNGSDEYVSTGYNPFTNATTRTFVGRAWRDNTAGVHALMSGAAATGQGPFLFLNNASTTVSFRPRGDVFGAGQQTNWSNAWPGSAIWVSWALIFNESADTAELYLDGVSQGVNTGVTQAYDASPGNIQWSRYSDDLPFTSFWNGKQDEVAVFNRALTAAEIADLHFAAVRSDPSLSLADERTEPWRLIFGELVSGTHVGEVLDASERKLNFKLFQPSTIECKLPIQTAMATEILSRGEGQLIAYKGTTCQLTAELTTIETIGDASGVSLKLVATETMWPRLKKRLIGKTNLGFSVTTATDQGLVVQNLLDDINDEDDTGLANGSLQVTSNMTGGPWHFYPFTDWLMELASNLTSGIDFFQYPLDPSENSGFTGLLIARSTFGNDKPDVFIEYGWGQENARDFRYVIDAEGLANYIYVLPADFPDNVGLTIAEASDSTSITDRLRREVTVPNDLKALALREELADVHLELRKQPRELFMINPNAEQPGVEFGLGADYFLGDVIKGRVSAQGSVLLDGNVRVYGAELDISNEGLVVPTLTLVREE